MAVESKMTELGSNAPEFTLVEPSTGENVSLKDIRGENATVVAFICNHCPYVQHIIDGLVDLHQDYREKGVGFTDINSNDILTYPGDSPEKMVEFAREHKIDFPYLYDESQEVARAYGAACTPDFFVYDRELKLVYRGRMDESTPGNDEPVSGSDLRVALDALVAGDVIRTEQKPSMGCSIKWK